MCQFVCQPKNSSRSIMTRSISALCAFVLWVFSTPSFHAMKVNKSWGKDLKKKKVFSTLLNTKLVRVVACFLLFL